MNQQLDQPRSGTRFGAVVAGAVLTYAGSASLLLVGLMFALGTRDGSFLGSPTQEVGLAGASVPVDAARPVGIVLTAVGVALVVLATAVLRRSNGARIALTCLGALSVCGLGYLLVTTGEAFTLPMIGWVGVAVPLLWTGKLS